MLLGQCARASLPHGSADRNTIGPGVIWGGGGRSLTGARIETRPIGGPSHGRAVAPSRERGSKQLLQARGHERLRSLPHGSADRNYDIGIAIYRHPQSLPHGSADRNSSASKIHLSTAGRSLTGARIETGTARLQIRPYPGRSLTGARIETATPALALCAALSLPHGSADRNPDDLAARRQLAGRSLTGARIETHPPRSSRRRLRVAPSRERGSKPGHDGGRAADGRSLPHGSADRNSETRRCRNGRECRSLTGARIETALARPRICGLPVAPSRERGSKRGDVGIVGEGGRSLPHGSADRNIRQRPTRISGGRSLPHGSADRNHVLVERLRDEGKSLPHGSADRNCEERDLFALPDRSLPHGSADRNSVGWWAVAGDDCRSLTGARIETDLT